MKLTTEDTQLFYKLNWSLLFYANQKFNIIPGLTEPNFKKENVDKVVKIHQKIYQDLSLIDLFIKDNPFKLSPENLIIVESWKKKINSKFLLMKHSEEGTIFFDQSKASKAYAVLGLYDDLEDIFPKQYLPIMIETVLLPFKGKIVYNGLFISYNVHFGKSIRESFEMSFRESKSKYGVIISLDEPVVEKEDAEIELMKAYAKNRETSFNYGQEINRLLKKDPSLWSTYYQSLGKSEVRRLSKRLSELGAHSGYFAIFDDIIVASGQTEKELLEIINKLLPADKREYIYIFNYKRK